MQPILKAGHTSFGFSKMRVSCNNSNFKSVESIGIQISIMAQINTEEVYAFEDRELSHEL